MLIHLSPGASARTSISSAILIAVHLLVIKMNVIARHKVVARSGSDEANSELPRSRSEQAPQSQEQEK